MSKYLKSFRISVAELSFSFYMRVYDLRVGDWRPFRHGGL